jgi:hypothetical protein
MKPIYDSKGNLIKTGDRICGRYTTTLRSGKMYEVIEGIVEDAGNYPVPAIRIRKSDGSIYYAQPEYNRESQRFELVTRSNDCNLYLTTTKP